MTADIRQITLISAAIVLTPAMLLVVPLVTRQLGPLFGYLAVLAIYWMCFCIPIAWLFRRGEIRVSVHPNLQNTWIACAALGLPVIVSIGAYWGQSFQPKIWIIAIAVTCALINGPLEELAWRRTFRANSDDRLSFELLGLFLFTLWHVPLYFSKGISFDHGAIGLIGGALFLGSFWMVMTRASNSVGWPIISHTLVNMAAFVPFYQANFG